MKKRVLSVLTVLAMCLTMLPAPVWAEGGDSGDFTVTGGTPGTDYSYAGGVLTVLTGTALTVSSGGTATADRIAVAEGVTANVTIDNLSIDTTGGNAILLGSGSSLTLTLAGTNTLYPGVQKAGICVPGGTALTVNGSGTLNVYGGRIGSGGGGAGIGANKGESMGDITISGGHITAGIASEDGGAGIGWGGWGGSGGSITVTGGVITSSGKGDEKSFHASSTTIQGGVIYVNDDKLDNVSKSNCLFSKNNAAVVYGNMTLNEDLTLGALINLSIPEGAGLTVSSGVTLTNQGSITVKGTLTGEGTLANSGIVWNKGGTVDLTVTGDAIQAPSENQLTVGDFLLSPKGLIDGTDYAYSEGVLTVKNDTAITISSFGTTSERIDIADNIRANVTIKNLSIDTTVGNAIRLGSGSNLNLTLERTNSLYPADQKAGICVPEGTTLTVDGDGSLDVHGGRGGWEPAGAGIGSDKDQKLGDIVINGGHITTSAKGAGIGRGGWPGSVGGGSITVNGGFITSSGGGDEKSFHADGGITIQGGVIIIGDDKLDAVTKTGGIIVKNGTPAIYGNTTLEGTLTLPVGGTFVIPFGTTLTIADGATLQNEGTVLVSGKIAGTGAIQNNGTIQSYGDFVANTLTVNGNPVDNQAAGKLVVGDFLLAPDTLTADDYSYADGVLTIKSDALVTISTIQTASSRIEVSASNADITLDNASIDVSSDGSAIALVGTAKASFTLTGENFLKSGSNRAGLEVPENAAVTIGGTGSLEATGGSCGAGIGSGGDWITAGSIHITGGTVKATGGSDSAGIGGGRYGSFKEIKITGGTVEAHGNSRGAGIGTGLVPSDEGTTPVILIQNAAVKAFAGEGANAIGESYVPKINCLVTIQNSIVEAVNPHMNNTPSLDGTPTITDSLVYVSAGTPYPGQYAVYGDVDLTDDMTIGEGKSLIVPTGTSLTVSARTTMTNRGFISVEENGQLTINGALHNEGTILATGEADLIGGDKITGTPAQILPANAIAAGDLVIYPTEAGGSLTENTDYSYANHTLNILSSTPITVSGSTTQDQIAVGENVAADITLYNISIAFVSDPAQENPKAALDASAANHPVTLHLAGSNSLSSEYGRPGIWVPGKETAMFTIMDAEGDDSVGSLKATGGMFGAGIGDKGNWNTDNGSYITIESGVIVAQGGNSAAGIGGGNKSGGHHIYIKGGDVTAIGGDAYEYSINGGAGIGNGNGAEIIDNIPGQEGLSPCNDIYISGGTVTAIGGKYSSGIGGADENDADGIYITGGTVTATGGVNAAGIGGGCRASGRNITISGGTVIANVADEGGAGIGGGGADYFEYASAEPGIGQDIKITGGTVTATGGVNGAGIGGGYRGTGSRIEISQADPEVPTVVTATGGALSAGIGGGGGGSLGQDDGADGMDITISGGTVTATGGKNDFGTGGAGIGGGANNAGAANITISGGNVTAKAFKQNAGIGGKSASGIRLTGGTISAIGADAPAVGCRQESVSPCGSVLDGSAVLTASCTNYANPLSCLTITRGVIVNGTNATIYGSISLPDGTEIPEGIKVIVGDGAVLTIPAGTTTTNKGTIQILEGGKLVVEGTLINQGVISNQGTITNSGTISNDGQITTGAGSTVENGPGGTINNGSAGTIEIGGDLTNNGAVDNDGTVTNNGNITNNGTIGSDGTISNNGTVTNNPGGEITIGGGLNNGSDGTIDNDGNMTVTGDMNNQGTVDNGGNIDYTGGNYEGNPPTGDGTVNKPSGSGNGASSYPPTIETSDGGTVTVSPRYPEKGDIVIITPKPDEGKEVEKVTVTDKNGDSVKVTENPDGTFTFTQPAGKVKIEVIFDEAHMELPFEDVSDDAWYEDAVRFVYEKGMMTGTGKTTFSPDSITTRGMIVTILWRLEKEPVVNDAANFTDVAADRYCIEAVGWAASEGIVEGYGNGKFGPDDTITREQMTAILYRYAKYKGYDVTAGTDLSGYTDADSISGYAVDAMAWANAEGLINGVSAAVLNPTGSATRAQVAVILKRFVENIGK